MIPSRAYDVLKPVTTTVLPGVIALYVALATLWDWTNTDKVSGSIAALNVFLGLLVTLSSSKYNNADASNPAGRFDGDVVTDGTTLSSLELNRPLPELRADKDELRIKMVAPRNPDEIPHLL
jgi:putative holin Dp-1